MSTATTDALSKSPVTVSREKASSFSYDYRIVREKAAVVLEFGTAVFKCGFSQEHSPRHVSASTVGNFLRDTKHSPTWEDWKGYAARVLKWVRYLLMNDTCGERSMRREAFLMEMYRVGLFVLVFGARTCPLSPCRHFLWLYKRNQRSVPW